MNDDFGEGFTERSLLENIIVVFGDRGLVEDWWIWDLMDLAGNRFKSKRYA